MSATVKLVEGQHIIFTDPIHAFVAKQHKKAHVVYASKLTLLGDIS